MPFEAEGCHSVYHVYAVRTPNRDSVVEQLRSAGIGVGVHYPLPVHRQPAYAHLDLPEGSYPVSEACSRGVMSLPMYPELTREQIEQVVGVIRDLVG